ncbi:RagB/SusD family nutrient uptake outer membrane protein [Rhodocytophaga aerolata]|uniref:RagB/SusD family nutrient uptake outer membrane protein n=1 Tax=Rhodocytophaga aerolata TaxID=455078 RepID=A0ABT8RI23_9BACT|nr:RagB/SusD family nutrient uptake outer membrane protein [Rhodocytophaga aerolata]MDO1450445.1 RagB/SusD family nutrient uptake outer membrane protein [Rhodocytophaga aerolata]
MKKLPFLLLLLLFSGCNDLLEEVPQDRLSQENFYKTKEDAIAGLNAVYSQMRVGDAYGSWYPAIMVGLDDYTLARGSQVPISEYQGMGALIGRTDNLWRIFYQCINSANIVIDLAPGIAMSETDRNAIIGEARFLRALNYYNLVRNFGGVPLRTTSTTKLDQVGGKRASVEEVYNQIIEDLQFSETSLPATVSQIGRPTSWAAKTLLADVYLTRENWASARDKALEVIQSGAFSLVEVKTPDDFLKVFGPEIVTSTEEVFSLKFARIAGQGWGYVIFPHPGDTYYAVGGFRAHYAKPEFPLIKNWSNADLRKEYNLYSEYTNRAGKVVQLPAAEPICFRKYRDGVSDQYGNDFPLLRYADALLIYAEAASQANNGPTAEALEYLNRVHRRAYGYTPTLPSPVDFTLEGYTAQTFRDLVLTERAYEFMLEFKRWYDLKRLGTDRLKAIIKESLGKDVADSHLLWPIPKQEIDNNPDINAEDQNPGY